MKAQRGFFLSCLIIVFGFAITIATVFLIFDQGFRNSLGQFPGWFSAFLVLFLLARVAALYAIWDFRRWGVYVFLLLECLEGAMGLFVFKSVFPQPMRTVAVVSSLLVLFAIWFMALRPKWQQFK